MRHGCNLVTPPTETGGKQGTQNRNLNQRATGLLAPSREVGRFGNGSSARGPT